MTTKKAVKAAPKWEIKDRTYYLISERQPITYTLASKHGVRHPLLWFDEEKGYARELRYASNQPSPFIDEQVGYSTLKHIVGIVQTISFNFRLYNIVVLPALSKPNIKPLTFW